MTRFVALLLLLAAAPAHAGGPFLPMRGVRAAARGGAFVAGADDPQALWYNPAGLATLAGGARAVEVLLDAAIVDHDLTYTRIDSGGTALPPVSSEPQLLPVPTLAVEVDLGSRLALGAGLLTPYSALDGFPEKGPQRYALVDLHHTVIAIAEVGLAYKVTDWLSVGAGVQDMILHFSSRTVLSACPSQITCAPEDPDYDSLGELSGTSAFNPSAVFGLQGRPVSWLALGAAVQLPVVVSMPSTIRVRLPSSGFFNGAHVEGDRADLSLTFPAMLRVGLEVAPSPRLRVEAGFDWEMWSQQQELRVEPKNVRVENVAGVGTYDLGAFDIVRHFEDTFAFRLGVEAQPMVKLPFTLRAGFVHETGAAPDSYLSVSAVDTEKNALTIGVGYQLGRVRIDAMYGHVFMASRVVSQGTSCVPLINPIRGGAAEPSSCVHDGSPEHVYVGDGKYDSAWNVFGLGTAIDF